MAAQRPELYLHEQILLLALRDEKGTIESRATMYAYALAGALLTELQLAERIRIAEGDKALVDVVDRRPVREPLLDECLQLIAGSGRRRRAQHWVSRFTRIKRLKHRVAEGLCKRKILRATEDTVLFVFSRTVYPTVNSRPEQRLIEQLRRAIASDSRTVAPRTAILAALAHSSGILRVHFDRQQLKARKERLDRLVSGDLVGKATRESVKAAQAAAAAAAAAGASAATGS
jgi:hypothetical protein